VGARAVQGGTGQCRAVQGDMWGARAVQGCTGRYVGARAVQGGPSGAEGPKQSDDPPVGRSDGATARRELYQKRGRRKHPQVRVVPARPRARARAWAHSCIHERIQARAEARAPSVSGGRTATGILRRHCRRANRRTSSLVPAAAASERRRAYNGTSTTIKRVRRSIQPYRRRYWHCARAGRSSPPALLAR
jgi:hypothetical protein